MKTTVAEHYADLTESIETFGQDLLVIHFGLWGPETANHREALIRAHDTLIDGCEPGPGKHILDAGCGIGGNSIALAANHGARVTGITICEPHVEVARQHAKDRGVDHLVEFRHGDFMDLPFPDATFDAVLNHESFCYASDKPAYLRGVYRVLKPVGRWRAVEMLASGSRMSASQYELHAITQRGWRMPPLAPWRDVLQYLEELGYERIHSRDLDDEALESTKAVRDEYIFMTMMNRDYPGKNPSSEEFIQAAATYHEGLSEGAFAYRLLSGTKPPKMPQTGSDPRGVRHADIQSRPKPPPGA